ncbi:hypothetical protein J7426_14415 [Tropicibacter sp. R16_0]|uniref:hypothetical protein n=1 Tax=Tropicibacter sp. R16_0 TaxID=2821102 RepID=UPI001ADBD573|nr:hypothetical protein [Tropicibacter sp. R16_0]MBO9451464.1 hypothetical protein [Tropicibacter sp. R16_0]
MAKSTGTWRAPANTDTERHVDQLLKRIDCFCSERGWSHGYFSKTAAGDMTVVDRLKASGRVTAALMSRIEAYLAAQETAQAEAAE